MTQKYRHLFGPVPSRRLGRSLGVDLVPYKTCSFDCIFCQLGRTTNKTVLRKEYVPVDDVIRELNEWLKTENRADYITLSGSGEPTLNSGFGRVIDFLHNATDIPVALLTNGSLLSLPEVREQAIKSDVLKISLSAWDEFSFQHINRPHPKINLKRMFESFMLLQNSHKGQLWIEVFLMWGTNTTVKDVSRIAGLIKEIGPDKVQLNTSVRPPCEEFAYPVPQEKMTELTKLFEPKAEVIAEYSSHISPKVETGGKEIRQMLQRRPCTLEDICQSFGLHKNEALKFIGKLLRTEQIKQYRRSDSIYYTGTMLPEEETAKPETERPAQKTPSTSSMSSLSSNSSKETTVEKIHHLKGKTD